MWPQLSEHREAPKESGSCFQLLTPPPLGNKIHTKCPLELEADMTVIMCCISKWLFEWECFSPCFLGAQLLLCSCQNEGRRVIMSLSRHRKNILSIGMIWERKGIGCLSSFLGFREHFSILRTSMKWGERAANIACATRTQMYLVLQSDLGKQPSPYQVLFKQSRGVLLWHKISALLEVAGWGHERGLG